jgi:hypothetical protein
MALTRAQLSDPDCPVSDADYEAIETAIMETARGRWFLSEYARRHRHADTLMLLAGINALHGSLQANLRSDLAATLEPPRRATPGFPVTARVTPPLRVVPVAPRPEPAVPPEPLAKPAAAAPVLPADTLDRFDFN